MSFRTCLLPSGGGQIHDSAKSPCNQDKLWLSEESYFPWRYSAPILKRFPTLRPMISVYSGDTKKNSSYSCRSYPCEHFYEELFPNFTLQPTNISLENWLFSV